MSSTLFPSRWKYFGLQLSTRWRIQPRLSSVVLQELGMMLLRADRSTEAEEVSRDLKRFPDNGCCVAWNWTLASTEG